MIKFSELKIGQEFVFDYERKNPEECWVVFSTFIKIGEHTYNNDCGTVLTDNRAKKNNKNPKIKGYCHLNTSVYTLEALRNDIQNKICR